MCIRDRERYLEILEFTHFVEFFSFNKIGENHKEKLLVQRVTVVVALDPVSYTHLDVYKRQEDPGTCHEPKQTSVKSGYYQKRSTRTHYEPDL